MWGKRPDRRLLTCHCETVVKFGPGPPHPQIVA
uniref:Uncharacterized protein n=1 Tax=Anguilla anguilla TaxID=7936 RepID=A0A0E9PX02_ANGAN